MAVDVDRVLAAALPAVRTAWEPRDVILYHLGLGAGVPPTDPRELAYAYEDGLRVLPTFATVPAFAWLPKIDAIDGLDCDAAVRVHGEQDLEVHAPLPASGTVETTGRIAGIYDKGSGALLVLEAVSRDAATGDTLCVNRFSTFLRGAGGFGGESGPKAGDAPPPRPPDAEVACPTLPQQALLYRLSGDRNPLHVDPALAARGGFDRPILHGLCTYGIAAKAVVDHALDGAVERVARYRARFVGVLFPGETLVVSLWDEGDRIVLAGRAQERDAPVLGNAAITLRSET